MAPDGEEQDAYILGVDAPVEVFTGKVVAVIRRKNDVEEKWVVCPENMAFTREEIVEQVKFQEQYFKSEIVLGAEEGSDATKPNFIPQFDHFIHYSALL